MCVRGGTWVLEDEGPSNILSYFKEHSCSEPGVTSSLFLQPLSFRLSKLEDFQISSSLAMFNMMLSTLGVSASAVLIFQF